LVRVLTTAGRWLTAGPPLVTPVDTTGAGDALKAGMIFGWLRDWSIEPTLRWAIAAASLQCTHYGPCEQPAGRDEIEQLMTGIIIQETNERETHR
jgi:sugar/nucleoside kinase (ribokinase family)